MTLLVHSPLSNVSFQIGLAQLKPSDAAQLVQEILPDEEIPDFEALANASCQSVILPGLVKREDQHQSDDEAPGLPPVPIENQQTAGVPTPTPPVTAVEKPTEEPENLVPTESAVAENPHVENSDKVAVPVEQGADEEKGAQTQTVELEETPAFLQAEQVMLKSLFPPDQDVTPPSTSAAPDVQPTEPQTAAVVTMAGVKEVQMGEPDIQTCPPTQPSQPETVAPETVAQPEPSQAPEEAQAPEEEEDDQDGDRPKPGKKRKGTLDEADGPVSKRNPKEPTAKASAAKAKAIKGANNYEKKDKKSKKDKNADSKAQTTLKGFLK